MNIHDKLKHLSLESIEELMDLYYSGAKTTKELLELYDIKVSPSQLYTLFPHVEVKDNSCRHCGGKLYIKRPSKTSYPNNNNIPYCIECGHEEGYSCKCVQCMKEREIQLKIREKEKRDLLESRRNLIKNTYKLSSENFEVYEDLEFLDKIFLGSLCRYGLNEDGSTIKELESIDGVLAPHNMKLEIPKKLYHNNIILVHPDSDINSFANDERFPNVFYISKVIYYLNIKHESNKVDTINKILNPNLDLEEHIESTYELWREIALGECLDYLLYQMNKVGFSFSIGEKTIVVMNNLLNDFSVSQIYSIIYNSISKATRYYQESNITKKQASNSVITRCESYGERALIEGWNITKYTRVKDLPQSSLSEFLFNKVFKIGDKCFHEKPSVDILEEYINSK